MADCNLRMLVGEHGGNIDALHVGIHRLIANLRYHRDAGTCRDVGFVRETPGQARGDGCPCHAGLDPASRERSPDI